MKDVTRTKIAAMEKRTFFSLSGLGNRFVSAGGAVIVVSGGE
jgi:hypothetical protein